MTEYGLIGYPLGHSFSRKFFTDKFAGEGTDATYLNFEIPDINMLPDIIREHPELRGLNCTIPYKEAVIALLDDISPAAREIGAVNVIKIERTPEENGGLHGMGFRLTGFNSDIIGFKESISPLLRPHHAQAMVLGTGGAAKAVVTGLKQLGIAPVCVSRSAGKGHLTYDDITPDTMRRYSVIVNCSPVGMFPHTDEAPAMPYEAVTPDHLLYDLIYNPEETLFLRKGREAGAATANGLDMLRLQALAGWDIWIK
ncbi:MAG: shikimate dehydrogenase [Bacteroidaceae bacterium]|nr:shikimate dehydrogenase [Bacteroidaceae bacterium]